MAGRILGKGIKSLLRQVIGDPIVGPEMTRRVREMDDAGWYPWEDYLEVLRRLEDKLSTRGLAALAFNAAHSEREALLAAGLDTPEKIFTNYAMLTGFYTADLAPESIPRTLSVGPTHATLEFRADIPRSFSEGYLRGFVAAVGGTLERFSATSFEREGQPFMRFEVQWS